MAVVCPRGEISHAGCGPGNQGRVRVNRERVTKPSQTLRVGDVVTVTVARGCAFSRCWRLGYGVARLPRR
ncbi:MAG: S4 domain-containing protein [Hyphomicrobiaceae bacterium]